MSTSPSPEQDVFAFRKLARRRAWICPGAGFALIGRKRLGQLTYFTGLAALAAATATALHSTSALVQATVAAVVLATLLWIIEISATSNAWPPGEPTVAAGRRHITGALVLTLAALGFGLTMFLSFQLIAIQDEGMAPAVWSNERLLFHRHVDRARLQRGALILFELPPENNFTEAGTLMLGRIMAVPGDKVSVSNFRYRVNDAGVYTSKNGDRREATFVDGVAQGQGVYHFSNGDRYDGEFQSGALTGKGKYYYSNGLRTEGTYVNGALKGSGIFVFNEGSWFEGDFDGEGRAKGVQIFKDGRRIPALINNGRVEPLADAK